MNLVGVTFLSVTSQKIERSANGSFVGAYFVRYAVRIPFLLVPFLWVPFLERTILAYRFYAYCLVHAFCAYLSQDRIQLNSQNTIDIHFP